MGAMIPAVVVALLLMAWPPNVPSVEAQGRSGRHLSGRPRPSPPPVPDATEKAGDYGLLNADVLEAISRGEGRPALQAYEKAAAEAESQGRTTTVVRAHAAAAFAAMRLSMLDRAIGHATKALEAAKRAPPSPEITQAVLTSRLALGQSYRAVGNREEARRALEEGPVVARGRTGAIGGNASVVGLQPAFLYAGTAAVVTTLWKVDDRASFLLMRAFYEHLAARGPADALRAAQRAVMVDHPHPFAWAAFTLAGNPR